MDKTYSETQGQPNPLERKITVYATRIENILHAYAMLQVGRDNGDEPEEIMKRLLLDTLLRPICGADRTKLSPAELRKARELPLSQPAQERSDEPCRRQSPSDQSPSSNAAPDVQSVGAASEEPKSLAMSPNWIEDYSHENGQYQNLCIFCDRHFIGHKRRVVCKICNSVLALRAQVESLTKERDELNKTQAVCHCGEYLKNHGYTDNHSGVEMKETCPYSIDMVEAKRESDSLHQQLAEANETIAKLKSNV